MGGPDLSYKFLVGIGMQHRDPVSTLALIGDRGEARWADWTAGMRTASRQHTHLNEKAIHARITVARLKNVATPLFFVQRQARKTAPEPGGCLVLLHVQRGTVIVNRKGKTVKAEIDHGAAVKYPGRTGRKRKRAIATVERNMQSMSFPGQRPAQAIPIGRSLWRQRQRQAEL